MKRTLAFILCFVMLFSLAMPFGVMAEETATATTVTTEFTDVPSDSPYKEAISTLTGLGIILGDAGANTFRPEAGITRAEFCVIVARLKNLGALNVPAETTFTDVTTALCDEWKVKAVRIASDLGIVAGMGDGTFAPDAPVTYEQAVKMLVCLLKYEPMAKQAGGWPAGYIAAGAQIGLTKKAIAIAAEPAPRQIIAQLVFNALDIPEMNNTSTGVATGGTTILDSNLKYTEKTGIVTATSDVSLTENSYIRSGYVQIDYDKIYKIGSSGADKYFGKEITFYYSEDDDDYIIQSCKPTNSNNESVFKPDEIKHLGQNEIEIYRDEDYDDYDVYTVESDVILIYNNYTAPYVESSTGFLDTEYKPYDGSLTLIDNDSNNTADIIIIEDAKPFVVSAVKSTATESILYDAYNPKDSLDLTEASNKVISIKKNGTTVSFSSLTKDTVLLVAQSKNEIGKGKKHINVEVVSNTKTGTITSMNAGDRIATIASKDYEIAEICWTNCESKFKKGSTVTIYLDSQERIVYVKLNSTATESFKYGYLIYAGAEGQGLDESKITVRLFTQDGLVKNYPLASKVQIDGDPKETEADALAALVFDPTVKTTINKDAGAELTANAQFIKYTLNGKSEINKILTAVPASTSTTVAENLVIGAGTTTAEYKSSTKMLGTHYIGSNTKIFFVPSKRSSADDYSVGLLSGGIPADQTTYTFETYDIENGTPKVLILFGDTSITETDYSAPLVVVTKIQDISTDNGEAHKFTAYLNGSEKTYTTEDLSVLEGVEVGDVIKLKITKNVVTKVLKMYSPENTNLKLQFQDNSIAGNKRFAATNGNDITKAKDNIDGGLDLRFCMMYGTVSKKYDGSFDIVLADVVENDTTTSLDEANPIRIVLGSSVVYYKYSVSDGKLTLGSEGDLLSYEDTLSGASKILVLTSYGTTKFILVVTP